MEDIKGKETMRKRTFIISCWLLVASCLPAYASPTSKKITLTCNSVAPDYVTANASIVLCASSASGLCNGDTFPCPQVSCDNVTTSMTVVCTATSKVDGLMGQANANDYDANGSQIGSGGSSPSSTLGGKGFSTTFPVTSNSGDTVTLTVK